MTGLETAFYIIGIVYMGISLLLLVAVIAAVFVIRAKIVSLENIIKDKLSLVTNITGRAADVVDTITKITKRKKH